MRLWLYAHITAGVVVCIFGLETDQGKGQGILDIEKAAKPMKKILVAYATNSDSTSHRSTMIDWTVQHELTAFFAFTFLLTWTFDGVVAAANLENNDTADLMILIGSYAPSISALVLSAIANPGANKPGLRERFLPFIPVLFMAAGIEGLDHIFWGHQIDLSLILVLRSWFYGYHGNDLIIDNRTDHLRLTGMTERRL
jgi:hypothetical protein